MFGPIKNEKFLDFGRHAGINGSRNGLCLIRNELSSAPSPGWHYNNIYFTTPPTPPLISLPQTLVNRLWPHADICFCYLFFPLRPINCASLADTTLNYFDNGFNYHFRTTGTVPLYDFPKLSPVAPRFIVVL